MLKQFAKKVAIGLNLLLALQIALFGLGADGALAVDVKVSPKISNVTIEGTAAEVSEVGNVITADVSELALVDRIDFELNIESTFELKNGAELLAEGDVSLGENSIMISEDYGDTLTIGDLRAASDEDGALVLSLIVTDKADVENFSNYIVNLITKDTKAPTLTSASLAGIVGSGSVNNFSINLQKSKNSELTLGSMVVSEDAILEIGEISVDLVKGINNVTIADLTGKATLVELVSLADETGMLEIVGYLKDLAGNPTPVALTVYVDVTKPIITVKPTLINNVTKEFDIIFTADEDVVLDKVEYEQTTGSLTVKSDLLAATKVDSKTFKLNISANTFIAGTSPILVKTSATDESGNVTVVEATIKLDSIAPLAVKNISAVVNEDGDVLLTWTNPNLADTYKTINIYRDGVFLTTLPIGTESFVDSNVEKGKEYYYEVVIADEAGNETRAPRVTIETPAPVVAAVASDTTVVTAPKTNDVEEKEVKSETAENKNEKKDEKKETLPLWGLIVLVVLAGVGGYLYFTNEKEEAPVAQIVKSPKQNSKKKVTNKKK